MKMTRPKKLTFVDGKRVLIDYATRQDEYRADNKDRWRYQKEIKRFYNSAAWRKLSKQVLNEHYYICRNCGNDAVLTDHIIPVKVDWDKRLDINNLQPLCEACHSIKTKKDREIFG